SFTVDAYPGKRFVGRVSQVRNAPTTVQNVVTYDVVVAVDNRELELKPGMTANIAITTARKDGVLRVPVRALRFRPSERAATPGGGGRRETPSVVHVVGADGTLRDVRIRPGIQDAQWAEVAEGELHEGDRVATGYHRPAETAASPAPNPFTPRRF